MSDGPEAQTMPIRCSPFARTHRLDPVGTAGSPQGYLLVEHPLPWPRDIGGAADLASLAREAKERGWRLQALVPQGEKAGLVVRYERPPGAFRGFEGGLRERIVLVCTHGKRDACCGSLGTALYRSVADLGLEVRVWRTSHTGGHRFAPTALILPEGTLWAYLDAELLAGIIQRTATPGDVLPHYRGCSGLDGPEAQAADREALGQEGWSWLDTPRRASVVGRDDKGSVVVRLAAAGVKYEAVVEVCRRVPVFDCGKGVDESKRLQPEYRVAEFGTVG